MVGRDFAIKMGLIGNKLSEGINYTGASREVQKCGVSRYAIPFVYSPGLVRLTDTCPNAP